MVRALMFQGTGSSVGKSVLVAGIARALTRQGIKVRPFKPQNMSNNAAITVDGGEIGRAQALQALACGVEPNVHMNPVLLKPQSETGSQIIVQGKRWGQAQARLYQAVKPQLLKYVLESFHLLAQQADIVLVEGAGSAAEINLRQHDIANMGFAEKANVPVILIGDIDRGGVIASLIGTYQVLSLKDRQRIKGFIVNKMRGDPSLFFEAMHWIDQQTQWQNLGLIPYLATLQNLPAEDCMELSSHKSKPDHDTIHIVVPLLPTIANFDDFDPLKQESNVHLEFVPLNKPAPLSADVIILPGSKSTISDLQALYAAHWDIDLLSHVRHGGFVMGICGGYQMLGKEILDPYKIESTCSRIRGLGLLEVSTILEKEKSLIQRKGHLLFNGDEVSGYEMHLGQTIASKDLHQFIQLENGQGEGFVSENKQIIGTYLHGIFHNTQARQTLLSHFGGKSSNQNYWSKVELSINQWADHLEKYVKMDSLFDLATEIKL